jgi:O-antigen/teichoic acid export membrane protein
MREFLWRFPNDMLISNQQQNPMLKSKFLQNNFIFMAGTLVGGLLGYAFHFFVSRQISVAQYGELQSLLSIMLIFGVFNSALGYFAIRHTAVFAAHDDWEANHVFTTYLQNKVFKFTATMLVVLIIASPLLAQILHFSNYAGFIVISFATFLSSMTVVYSEVLRGWNKFFLLTAIGTATALAKLLSGTILAFLTHNTAAVSVSFLIAAVVSWQLSKFLSKEKIANRDAENVKINWKNKYFSQTSIRKSAAHIFFFSLALILVSNLDVLLVKYFSSAETAGYFGAFGLLGKLVLWLNLPAVGVLLPEACADGHLGKRPAKNLMKSYGLMTIIALGLMAVYYFFPNFFVSIFFGEKYIFDTRILWLFALMSYLLSLLTLEANLSFAKRDFRVVYFLAATVILMVVSLSRYHASLEQIVLAFSGSFLIGYVAIIILNLYFNPPLLPRRG